MCRWLRDLGFRRSESFRSAAIYELRYEVTVGRFLVFRAMVWEEGRHWITHGVGACGARTYFSAPSGARAALRVQLAVAQDCTCGR